MAGASTSGRVAVSRSKVRSLKPFRRTAGDRAAGTIGLVVIVVSALLLWLEDRTGTRAGLPRLVAADPGRRAVGRRDLA